MKLKEWKSRPGHVRYPDGKVGTIEEARANGHTVVTLAEQKAEADETRAEAARVAEADTPAGRAAALVAKAKAEADAYSAAILALPEAADRPRTAARITRCHNARSMPVAQAALFLRGLPPETAPEATAARPITDPPSLKRRVEIAATAAGLKADRGDAEARRRADALRYALRVAAEPGLGYTLNAALAASGVDPATLELR